MALQYLFVCKARPPAAPNRYIEFVYAAESIALSREESVDMAKTYADVQKQIAALQKTADALRQKEIAGVVDRIKVAIATYQLSADDLGLNGSHDGSRSDGGPVRNRQQKARSSKPPKKAAAVVYRDENGKTWSGHGRRPGWFLAALAAGKTVDDLRA